MHRYLHYCRRLNQCLREFSWGPRSTRESTVQCTDIFCVQCRFNRCYYVDRALNEPMHWPVMFYWRYMYYNTCLTGVMFSSWACASDLELISSLIFSSSKCFLWFFLDVQNRAWASVHVFKAKLLTQEPPLIVRSMTKNYRTWIKSSVLHLLVTLDPR